MVTRSPLMLTSTSFASIPGSSAFIIRWVAVSETSTNGCHFGKPIQDNGFSPKMRVKRSFISLRSLLISPNDFQGTISIIFLLSQISLKNNQRKPKLSDCQGCRRYKKISLRYSPLFILWGIEICKLEM